jgi:hypothetical protein
MKTAVEWLVEKHFGSIENCSPNFRNHIEQAKEMEKEQIINAYNKSFELRDKPYSTAIKYYNETFKSE